MSKKSLKSQEQSMIDNTRDAKNASHGFKSGASAGTKGVGDTYGGRK